MAAGNKKYKIEVYELMREQTSTGSENEVYRFKFKLNAEIKYNNNNILLLNNEIIQVDRLTLIIYKRDINYTDKIKYNNDDYSIVSINPYFKNELEIIVERINI